MATRQTTIRRITTLDGGSKKVESAAGQPAVETENARLDKIGPFRHANCAIDLAAVQMGFGGISGAEADTPLGVVAPRAGAIVGITYAFDAAISAGGATAAQIQATVAPGGVAGAVAAKGDLFPVASGGAQSAVLDETKGSVTKPVFDKGFIPFSEGDYLGAQLTTSHTFAPTTADLDVFLLVRYAS